VTLSLPPLSGLRLFEAAARCGGFLGEGLDLHSKKRRKPMWIRSTLIVATAIATLGLGSPAFAGGGDDSNDTGNTRPSYYDKNGWHLGLPPEALRARAAPQRQSARPGNDWFWGGSR
jgi:hypothetical protein